MASALVGGVASISFLFGAAMQVAADTSSAGGSDVLGTPAAEQSSVSVSDAYPTVGETVKYKVLGLAPNATYQLLWETFKGTWNTDGNTFVGESYSTGVTTIARVTSDASGAVNASFVVPKGYGDIHQVGLLDGNGQVVAQGSVTVKPSVSIEKKVEPEGGFFTVHVDGIGYGAYSSAYEALYDNKLMGNITAVTTDGSATFQVRAEGVGAHQIEIVPCSIGSPYLNEQQSPYSWKPTFDIPVTVTTGTPTDVFDSIPAPSPSVGDHLVATPGHGTVGSTFTLTGSSLPANQQVTIEWSNTVGNHVTSAGFHGAETVLAEAATDSKGDLSAKITVPVNVGGPAHTIEVVDSQGNVIGTTDYQIYPSFVSAPKTVKEGQILTVHLQGGGPDTYDNCYSVLYDNGSIGYACGFNSNGDMQIQIRATGAPGVHYVDLYPTIQQGNQKVPNLYVLPLLTYQADHPGEREPAFHIVFTIQK